MSYKIYLLGRLGAYNVNATNDWRTKLKSNTHTHTILLQTTDFIVWRVGGFFFLSANGDLEIWRNNDIAEMYIVRICMLKRFVSNL